MNKDVALIILGLIVVSTVSGTIGYHVSTLEHEQRAIENAAVYTDQLVSQILQMQLALVSERAISQNYSQQLLDQADQIRWMQQSLDGQSNQLSKYQYWYPKVLDAYEALMEEYNVTVPDWLVDAFDLASPY